MSLGRFSKNSIDVLLESDLFPLATLNNICGIFEFLFTTGTKGVTKMMVVTELAIANGIVLMWE